MSEPSTYIKLDRNILAWEWYTDQITKSVFIHLLLTANIKESRFSGRVIRRGELVTSYKVLAKELKFTESQIRTALNHLKKTGEVAVKTTNKYSIITVLNYDKYQSSITGRSQASNKQVTGKSQRLKNIRNKEQKKDNQKPDDQPAKSDTSNGEYIPTAWELYNHVPERYYGQFRTEDEWFEFTSQHWEEVQA